MSKALTLHELTQLIHRHAAAFADVARQPSITVDQLAYAVSKLAIDPDAARDVVATSTGRPLADVSSGFATLVQASIIAGQTLASHAPERVAEIFYGMVAPGFGSETGRVQ